MANNNAVAELETAEIMKTETVSEPSTKSHKEVKSVKAAKSQKNGSKTAKKGKSDKSYKRGSLTAAMYALFDSKGVDNVDLDGALKLALSVKSDSKFNKYHLAWYKNAYRNKE
jgi:hypothetical protein